MGSGNASTMARRRFFLAWMPNGRNVRGGRKDADSKANGERHPQARHDLLVVQQIRYQCRENPPQLPMIWRVKRIQDSTKMGAYKTAAEPQIRAAKKPIRAFHHSVPPSVPEIALPCGA